MVPDYHIDPDQTNWRLASSSRKSARCPHASAPEPARSLRPASPPASGKPARLRGCSAAPELYQGRGCTWRDAECCQRPGPHTGGIFWHRPLFRRNGREVHVTAQGRTLLPRVQQALEQLECAIDDARTQRYSGTLKLSTLASYMQQWLLPRLSRFRAQHGDIDLHLHSSGDVVDFMREEFQLAIRFGTGPWPNVQAEKLMDCRYVHPPCARNMARC